MKKILLLLLWVLSLLVSFKAGKWNAKSISPDRQEVAEPVTLNFTTPTVEQVQALSSLVTQRVDVAEACETTLEGYTGSIRAVLLAHGDVLLAVDLAGAKFEGVDPTARTAVIALPPPQVRSPRLDHRRTRLLAISESGLWQITPGDNRTSSTVIEQAYRQAQAAIARVGNDPDLLARARHQTERVLGAFFAATGWKIRVQWMQ